MSNKDDALYFTPNQRYANLTYMVSSQPTNITYANVTNNTTEICMPSFSMQKYYLYGLIPAFLMVVLLGFTTRRANACRSFCNGKPGIIVPLDILDSRSLRFSYAAAYGLTVHICINMFFSISKPVRPVGPAYLSIFFDVIAVLVYGTFFYPIFACLTVNNTLGYLMGTIWVWQYGGVSLYQSYVCVEENDLLMSVMLDVPFTICLLYLTISFPWRFIVSLRNSKPSLNVTSWKECYQAKYVRRLFAPEEKRNEVERNSNILSTLKKHTYESVPGFRYSTRVVSTYTVGFIVLYILTVEAINLFEITFLSLNAVVQAAIKGEKSSPAAVLLRSLIDVCGGIHKDTENILLLYIKVFQICCYVSIALSALITILVMLHSLSTYRNNLLELYSGKHILPHRTTYGNATLTGAAVQYAGYLVAYVAFGFMLVAVVLLLLSYMLACVIFIPIFNGFGNFILHWFMNWWPGYIILLALGFMPTLLAKFIFLQQRGNVLAINNRKGFFIFTYYMFFLNLFLGLLSCLFRIGLSAVIGVLFISRLDSSFITRRFEIFDPGYSAYIGFLYVEEEHTHPVLMAFCQLLTHLQSEKQEEPETNTCLIVNEHVPQSDSPALPTEGMLASKRAKTRWFVAYTLIFNPKLRFSRKDGLDPLRGVLANGVNTSIQNVPEDVHYVECNEHTTDPFASLL